MHRLRLTRSPARLYDRNVLSQFKRQRPDLPIFFLWLLCAALNALKVGKRSVGKLVYYLLKSPAFAVYSASAAFWGEVRHPRRGDRAALCERSDRDV